MASRNCRRVDTRRCSPRPSRLSGDPRRPGERSASERTLETGEARLLFVSPERLVLTDFHILVRRLAVRTFAIDEAHCISHWGHDFRPEYRQLNLLKERYPEASVHAYTATATERVRQDIIDQLSPCQRDLIDAIYRDPLGQIEIHRSGDAVETCAMISRVFRRARIVISVATCRQAR